MSINIGTSLSILCSVILIAFWFLNPKWRSLHNFIGIHQIVFATLHLCAMNIDWPGLLEVLLTLTDYLFLASLCWTLCASLVSYLRLVLLLTGKITCEKRIAAAFTYGVLFVIVGITDWIVPHICKLSVTLEYFAARCLSAEVINSINLFFFMCVVRSVLSHGDISITRQGGTRLIPLLGVAVLCDLITSLYLILLLPEQLVFEDLSFLYTLFNYRLIGQTLVLLFNRKTKEYWKRRKQLMELKRFQV